MNFHIESSDVAEMEIENTYFSLMGRSPEFAERWRDELDDAIASLQFMPRFSRIPNSIVNRVRPRCFDAA